MSEQKTPSLDFDLIKEMLGAEQIKIRAIQNDTCVLWSTGVELSINNVTVRDIVHGTLMLPTTGQLMTGSYKFDKPVSPDPGRVARRIYTEGAVDSEAAFVVMVSGIIDSVLIDINLNLSDAAYLKGYVSVSGIKQECLPSGLLGLKDC